MCWQASPTVCLLLGEAATKNAVAAQQKAVYRDKDWGPEGEEWERGRGKQGKGSGSKAGIQKNRK